MTTFILIHGMWHGGWCWQKVARRLRAAGHEVYTPTLTGLGDRSHLRGDQIDLNIHIQDVINLLEYEDIRSATLVGHSFGGTMAPLIADRVPDRIAGLINIDGPIIKDGLALKDLIGDIWEFFQQHARESGDEWWIPPAPDWTFGVTGEDLAWMKSKLIPHPLRALLTPISLTNPVIQITPCTYISCVEDASPDQIKIEAKGFSARGWEYRSLATGHDAMITMPEELTSILLQLSQ